MAVKVDDPRDQAAQPYAAANPAGASRLQSLRPVRRVAELGSLSSMSESVAYILGIAAMAVVAFVLLALRDKSRSKKLMQQLQKRLSDRQDCPDPELISTFPLQREQEIAIKFRSRLSEALGVEAQKIHPDDDLHRDYHLDTIWPFLIAAVASEFTRDPTKAGAQEALKFRNESTTFRDFVRAISQQSA